LLTSSNRTNDSPSEREVATAPMGVALPSLAWSFRVPSAGHR